jgi:hypothetical protein
MIGQLNTGNKVETAYGVEGAKADVAERTTALTSARAAAQGFPSLNEAYRLLQKGNVVTGVGSKPILGIHRVLSSMGIKPSEDAVEDTQVASRLLYEGVAAQLQARTFGSGTAVSENDRKAAEGMAGVDFSANLGSLKKITRINVGLSIEKMIGATMLLDQQMQSHPDGTRDLTIKKKSIEAQLYGPKGSKENPTPGSIWGQYLEMLAKETGDEVKARTTMQGVGDQIFGGPQ